ncbi:hypothetical protein [Billgrantia gudaonensis]|uniref:Uncharacterized protein n=1 Tax=Billgrantia gudaonensis TaxID=376427 RepID=A0A1G8R1C4_9GAMM|nr:hypothetical protein [Halomonas gudaonensis]SDJ10772.1 hypothetical protein SAMN04487954_10359 [Halomonas gudaonensis]
MNRPVSGSAFLARNLKETTDAIGEIAQLVREDQLRRDTDDQAPFLSPGSVDMLMAGIRQLSDRAATICDDMEQLCERRGRP